MTQILLTQLLAAFKSESLALDHFVALLKKEQAMLVENLTSQLIELSEQKTTLAISLNDLAQARRALLQKHIPTLSLESIGAWLKTNCPEGLIVWQKIIDSAKESQRLNQANGELIQMKLRHNQQSLAVLSNAFNQANLYGPDGQTNFKPGSGRSLGSV